ncbi:f8921658-439b-4469-aae0-2ac0945003d8 [Sclerotinia trifoliorum]|uniref:F8921658-439b-4469-aae0-2ac0945003d8 n=1 Tax=Sclerotinia trifoliorum TaxID=28548 RepID=A0A8H2ZPM4_9HELO|nr:f8921658-439b-4469-aae0-2ac0945003d8 [Sclerotinia trifoliorum]
MEKTPESLAQEIAAMREQLNKVSKAINAYESVATGNFDKKDTQSKGEISQKHVELFMETDRLMKKVRGPVDMVFSNFENSVHSGTLRTVLEMGVFDALPMDGSSSSATILAENLGVEKELLVRFMRVLTAAGPFAEVGEEEYAHTPYSMVYMAPEFRGIFKLMYDEYNLANARMYQFFRENGFKSPEDHHVNPYCFAHQTGEKNMWEHIESSPERFQNLNLAMMAQSVATNWTVGIFPFRDTLKEVKSDEETVLVLDIGGGSGHVTKQIMEFVKGIPGKVVLQERDELIDAVAHTIPEVVTMKYDFFTPQPIKGAPIYYIRRCLHDWPDADCVRILKVIAAAMTPEFSRLVISEIVLPPIAADVEASWMDVTMMALSGCERTEKQWVTLLTLSGLKLRKIHHGPGTNYAAIEAVLA